MSVRIVPQAANVVAPAVIKTKTEPEQVCAIFGD
jgi:hypothetical protein